MVLSAVGGAAGIALAYGLTQGLIALDPLKIPRVQDIALDGRVLAFTAAISLITGVLFGIVPALQSSRTDLQSVLKEGGRDSRVATGWLRRVLVVGEIAASVVLVAAAMLLARSFARLLDVDAGFNPAHVLTLRTSLPGATYTDARRDGAARTPRSAAGCASRPACRPRAPSPACRSPARAATGASGSKDGRLIRARGLAADWQVVTPGYFEALGTPLRGGRTFTDADRADTLPVIVVNETMAKKYWPGVSTPSAGA